MTHEISGLERLFLWRLAVSGGGDWKKDLKPNLKASTRERLELAGLIKGEKRKSPSGRGIALFVSLTDEGWGWLAGHLDSDLASKSPAGTDVLRRLLGLLKAYLDTSQMTLGDLMLATAKPTGDAAISLEDQVIQAYLSISNGHNNVRVRLADLRGLLSSVPRPMFDHTLLSMASNGRASLYRLDDPTDIRDEDREAVLRTPSGEERHIVYLGGRGS